MKRFSVLLTVLLVGVFFSSHLFAQTKTFSGFYRTSAGEKIGGTFSDYMQWDKNPNQVSFVPSSSTGAITLTPSNCQMFLVEGYDEYLAYSGKRLTNPIGDTKTLQNNATENADDRYGEVATFLRLLKRTAGGELYILKDDIRTNFFVRLPGQPLVELRFKEYYDQIQIREFPEYRQQIQALFSEAIAKRRLSGALEDLRYTAEELSAFFRKLFPSAERAVKPNKEDDGVVIAGGVSLNFLRVEGNPGAIDVGKEYRPSVSPLLSIGYMLVSERGFGKYFFYPQLKVFRHQNTADFIINETRTVVTYQSDLILLPEVNGGVNLVNKANMRFHVSFGIGLVTLFNNQHLRNRYTASSSDPYFTLQDKLTTSAFSANAAAGITVNKKILLIASYQIPSTVGHIDFYSPVYSAMQLRFGYKF